MCILYKCCIYTHIYVLINRDNLYARFMWWTAVSTFCVFEAAAPYPGRYIALRI